MELVSLCFGSSGFRLALLLICFVCSLPILFVTYICRMNTDNPELPPEDYREYANTDYWEERFVLLG